MAEWIYYIENKTRDNVINRWMDRSVKIITQMCS